LGIARRSLTKADTSLALDPDLRAASHWHPLLIRSSPASAAATARTCPDSVVGQGWAAIGAPGIDTKQSSGPSATVSE